MILIKLNKRIVSQNNKLINQNIEIIELLKKIVKNEPVEAEIETDDVSEIIFNPDSAVGEVYFIEDENIFRLTIENNETTVINLTGSAEAKDFELQETIAKESVTNNAEIPSSTIILSKQQAENLPSALKICIEQEVETVYIPFYSTTQLIGAPDELMTLIKVELYKETEDLLEKLF